MKKHFFLYFFCFLILLNCGKEATERETISYTLTITGTTGGEVNSNGGYYTEGTQVNIQATPNAFYQFTGWSNGSTDNPLVINVNGNLNLRANFAKKSFPLNTLIEGNGTVEESIVSSGKKTDYIAESQVQLSANAADGWSFSSWSGNINSEENPIELSINGTKTVLATFIENNVEEPQGVVLAADGPGDTYALITSVLAPGYNPIETPDCNHTAFGDHIDEVYDNALDQFVFQFHLALGLCLY